MRKETRELSMPVSSSSYTAPTTWMCRYVECGMDLHSGRNDVVFLTCEQYVMADL